jgi:poly(ADP-ribose) glycohydrolase
MKNSLNFWAKSKSPLKNSSFELKPGKIENANPKQYLKTVFSNKKLGGGVLNNGGLQEELTFCMNCEMLISTLVFEELEDYEAALFLGCEQYNLTENYGEKFLFLADYKDKTPNDVFGKKDTVFIGMDAIQFEDKKEQYRLNLIVRELNKAYLGFQTCDSIENNNDRAIATGKWGCGDFQGDFELKMIIQWLAASENKRDIRFYLNGEEDEKKYQGFSERMKGKNVGEMVGILKDFSKTYVDDNVDVGVFEFIRDFWNE